MRGIWLAIALGFISTSALAEEVCGKLLDAYNEAGKEASLVWAKSVGDGSAARQTMSNVQINSYLVLKLINLQLIIYNKCPAPVEPERYTEYTSQALSCNVEIIKGVKNSPKCDLSTWRR